MQGFSKTLVTHTHTYGNFLCSRNMLSNVCLVFSSKSIISVPCWCWPVLCQGRGSTRWTWRWCPLTHCSAIRAATRPAPPSDSPSTSGRTPFKEEEEWRDTEKDGERETQMQNKWSMQFNQSL